MSDKFYKSVGLIALVVGARFLFFGFGPVGLPGTMSGVVTQQQEELSWQVSSPENDIHAGLLAEAAAEGVPVMVDFWATWCVQCKELDHKTWTDPAVFAEGQRFRRIKMDMTQSESDWARNQNEDFSVLGMPTVIFYGSNGQELKRFVGFQKPDKVLAWMQEVH